MTEGSNRQVESGNSFPWLHKYRGQEAAGELFFCKCDLGLVTFEIFFASEADIELYFYDANTVDIGAVDGKCP